MMGKSKTAVIVLIALGILVVLFAVGKALIEWEWWTFLLVLAGMAFTVALALFVVQRILQSARS
jgi:predicted membrane protein